MSLGETGPSASPPGIGLETILLVIGDEGIAIESRDEWTGYVSEMGSFTFLGGVAAASNIYTAESADTDALVALCAYVHELSPSDRCK